MVENRLVLRLTTTQGNKIALQDLIGK